MKISKLSVRCAGVAAALVVLQVKMASAQLLGNMNLNQSVVATYYNPPFQSTNQIPVTDTTVPFQKTVTANDGFGGSITAVYSVTDNGSVASVTITFSGSTTAAYNYMGEESVGTAGTTFQLLQPATFTSTVISTGTTPASTSAELEIDRNGALIEALSTVAGNNPNTYSGMLGPGLITFDDLWAGPNSVPSAAANQTGTGSVSITFTAIPEPSSALLIGIPAAAFLLRRRRTIRSQSAGTTRPPGN